MSNIKDEINTIVLGAYLAGIATALEQKPKNPDLSVKPRAEKLANLLADRLINSLGYSRLKGEKLPPIFLKELQALIEELKGETQ